MFTEVPSEVMHNAFNLAALAFANVMLIRDAWITTEYVHDCLASLHLQMKYQIPDFFLQSLTERQPHQVDCCISKLTARFGVLVPLAALQAHLVLYLRSNLFLTCYRCCRVFSSQTSLAFLINKRPYLQPFRNQQ